LRQLSSTHTCINHIFLPTVSPAREREREFSRFLFLSLLEVLALCFPGLCVSLPAGWRVAACWARNSSSCRMWGYRAFGVRGIRSEDASPAPFSVKVSCAWACARDSQFRCESAIQLVSASGSVRVLWLVNCGCAPFSNDFCKHQSFLNKKNYRGTTYFCKHLMRKRFQLAKVKVQIGPETTSIVYKLVSSSDVCVCTIVCVCVQLIKQHKGNLGQLEA